MRITTSKERFLASLNLGRIDRVPLFDFLESQNLFENLTGHRPSQYEAKEAVECAFKLGHDAVMIPFGGAVPYQDEQNVNIYVDEWGTTWKNTGYSWPVGAPIAYPIKTRDDLRKMKIPDPTIPERLNDIRAAMELTRNKIAIIGGILGPFSEVYYLMGLQALSIALYDDPNLVIDLHKVTSKFFVEAAKRMIDTGVDAIVIFEDLAFHSGPFLSPSHFRKFTLPYLAELVQEIRKRGIPVIFHSDGNLNLILEDLVDIGINALNPLEKNAHMDLSKIKEKYGKRICLIGGISNEVLSKGTVEDVVRETVRVIKIAAPGGGYIPTSDSGDLLDTMPMENIWAMINTIKKYGNYSHLGHAK